IPRARCPCHCAGRGSAGTRRVAAHGPTEGLPRWIEASGAPHGLAEEPLGASRRTLAEDVMVKEAIRKAPEGRPYGAWGREPQVRGSPPRPPSGFGGVTSCRCPTGTRPASRPPEMEGVSCTNGP